MQALLVEATSLPKTAAFDLIGRVGADTSVFGYAFLRRDTAFTPIPVRITDHGDLVVEVPAVSAGDSIVLLVGVELTSGTFHAPDAIFEWDSER